MDGLIPMAYRALKSYKAHRGYKGLSTAAAAAAEDLHDSADNNTSSSKRVGFFDNREQKLLEEGRSSRAARKQPQEIRQKRNREHSLFVPSM
ncbi:unnamed protein product [Linum trigynum]|uniref:Uncharacterized protein n=1 Tax=Linum trigynum TaxID=586398 RepID=A0AAV2E228_9ROSI